MRCKAIIIQKRRGITRRRTFTANSMEELMADVISSCLTPSTLDQFLHEMDKIKETVIKMS